MFSAMRPVSISGAGVDLLGAWFGTGQDRGLARPFTVTGAIGVVVTLLTARSFSYRQLPRATRSCDPDGMKIDRANGNDD
jgi:MFS transporter, DHA3 family, multidrug efflux protein